MSRNQHRQIDESTSSSIIRTPSFRSEIKIHFPKSASNHVIIQNSSKNRVITPSGETRIKCLPPDGKNSSFINSNRQKNPKTLKSSPDQSPINRQSIDGLYPASPNNQTTPPTVVKKSFIEFRRSSSLHPNSSTFLYPKSDVKINNLESIDPPPDRSQDDSIIYKSNSIKYKENSKSSDHLLDENIVKKRNESMKSSSEKRHSVCAMETEDVDVGSLDKSKRSHLDTMSLKPCNSTLSISKPNWFVKRYIERQESKLVKSASCRDLGGIDCEGWLWKKQERSGLKITRWILWWCVLEKKELKFYKEKECRSCEGTIYLPGMRVAPAPELDSKKGAFKVFHTGSTFFFHVDKREDMLKWMNKMSLATLSDFEVQSSKLIAGFQNDEEVEYNTQRSFSSDSEDNLSSNSSSPSLELGNPDRISRSSDTLQIVKKSPQITNYQLRSKLFKLSKLLKEKEEELSIIETFISNHEITGEDLKRFIKNQPVISQDISESGTNQENIHKPHLIITSPSTNDDSEDDYQMEGHKNGSPILETVVESSL